MSTVVTPEFAWWAKADDGDRHAWPQRTTDGFPPPSLCGTRWTVLYGHHGARYCAACLGALRRILAGAQDALVEAEYDNATGDLDVLIAVDENELRALWGDR